MSFKGDLSTIGLAEVFQMISMSQKEGTLVVKDHDSRKSIYFGPHGVRLLSTGRRKGHRLGDMLLRAGKVTQDQIDNALENSRIQKRMLGELLVEAGAVTEAEIDQVVREQIEEEIYDLFLWKKADFEFIEGPPGEGLTDGDSNVTRLAFDVNGLLLEAVRRADEWSVINQQVPSLDSVFVFVSEADRGEEDQVAPDALKRVYRLIDGERTLSEIVDNSGVGKFEVCKGIVDLLQRGRLRLLTVQEMMDLASRAKSGGAREKALRMFVAVAAQAPGDGKIVSGVARVLEGEGLSREAAIHHARAGKAYLDAGDPERALEHYRKAIQLSPEDATLREGLFEVHAAQGNLEDGKALAREIVSQALMTPDYPKALQFTDRIVSADPEDVDFRLLRARVYHRSGQKRELEAELEHIRKNLPADPREMERLEKELQEFTARAPSRSTKVPKAVHGPKGRSRIGPRALWTAAAFLLIGAAGAAVVYELKAKGSLDRALEAAQGLAEKDRFPEASGAIEGWLVGRFRFSPWQGDRARQELGQLEKRRADWERERASREEKQRAETLERLRQLASRIEVLRRTDPSQALALARELRGQAEEARDADLVRRAEELGSALDKYLAEALQLKVKADELEKLGKARDAAVMIDRLLMEYPNTDAARGALFPLEIVTRPAGVRVTSVRNELVIGETGEGPLKYRIRPGEPVKLRFEKGGYATVEREVKDKTVGKVVVHLVEKKYDWAKPLGISVTGEPVLNGETLYIADGSRLYALQTSPFRLLWSESLSGAVAGSPRAAGKRVFVGTGSRAVIALDPDRGAADRVVWRVEVPDRVSTSPGASPDGATLFVATGDRMLRALRSEDGEEIWKAPLPAEARQEPMCNGTVVVAACADGTVAAYKAATGEEAWKLRADGPLGPAILSGTAMYAASSDQHLYAIDVTRGQRLWRRLLPSQVTGRVAKVGETVVAAGRDGRVYLLAASTGESLGTFDEPQGPIQGGVTPVGPLAIFGSDDQWLYAYDVARQDLAWRLRSNGRIRLAPVLNGNRILFTSEDNLYSVDLE